MYRLHCSTTRGMLGIRSISSTIDSNSGGSQDDIFVSNSKAS